MLFKKSTRVTLLTCGLNCVRLKSYGFLLSAVYYTIENLPNNEHFKTLSVVFND